MSNPLRSLPALGLALSLFALAACSHAPGGIAASSTPLEGRNYRVVGHARGTDSYILLLGLIPIRGSNSTHEAVQAAIGQHNGDALINVTVTSYFQWWVILTRHAIQVEGDVIDFTD